MNSKLILLVGGFLSAIVVYFCLTTQYKNTLYKNEIHKNNSTTIKTKTVKIKNQVKNESQKLKQKPKNKTNNKNNNIKIENEILMPYIYYIPNQQLSLLLSKKENNQTKDFFQKICTNECIKDINFSNNVLNAKWIEIAKKAISFIRENNISKAKVSTVEEKIEINATLNSEEKYNSFIKLLSLFDKNLLTKSINLKVTPKEKKDDNLAQPISQEKVTKIDTSKIQNEINKTLEKHPIHFRNASSYLTKKAKRTLWKIIKILRKNKNIQYTILVTGHTNAVGDENFNKILSQKRADAVRWYLKQRVKNIKSISAAGFGSSRPKIKKYPRNRKNRRVEIIIKKAEYND